MENLCRFAPVKKDRFDCSVHIVNFVLETKPEIYEREHTESLHKAYFVLSGNAVLECGSRREPISSGDLFFTFPARSYRITEIDGLTLVYVSFLDVRAQAIFERLKIGVQNYLFHDMEELRQSWEGGVRRKTEIIDLAGESALLAAFTAIGERTVCAEENKTSDAFTQACKFVGENFSDPDLSLEMLGRELAYNKKYLSSLFKKNLKMGFREYLNLLRIQEARSLMEQGYRSVKGIAYRCGYDDSAYFSRVFKQQTGRCPKEYIVSLP